MQTERTRNIEHKYPPDKADHVGKTLRPVGRYEMISELALSLADDTGEIPQDFTPGKTIKKKNGETIQHYRLGEGVREGTGRMFETFEKLSRGLPVSEKANLIRDVFRDETFAGYLGYSKNQIRTVESSMISKLLVEEAKKLSPDQPPWKTVKDSRREALAESGQETSAFEALDRMLEIKEKENREILARILNSKEVQKVRDLWSQFSSFEWVNQIRPPNKALFARSLVPTILSIYSIGNYFDNTGPKNSEANFNFENTQNNYPTALYENPSPAGETPNSQLKNLAEGYVVYSSHEHVIPNPEEAVEKNPNKNEENGKPTITTPPSPEEEPEKENKPDNPEHTDPQKPAPRTVSAAPGNSLTFLSPENFEFTIDMISTGDFNEGGSNHDYVTKAAASGQLTINHEEGGHITSILLHSGIYNGEKLPGQNFKNLDSGEVIRIKDQNGKTVQIEYQGKVVFKIPSGGMDTLEPQKLIDENFNGENGAKARRENGENQIMLITCDPDSFVVLENGGYTFTRRTVYWFSIIDLED